MNKKVSIMDYKQGVVHNQQNLNFTQDMSVGNIIDKDAMISEMWSRVSDFKPEIKNLFGREHRLGFKYHINKLHIYYEEQVKLFELGYYNTLYKRFPKNILPAEAKAKFKRVKRNKFIPFYDDLKLLEAIDLYDLDWCEWRMMDDEAPKEPLQTGLDTSIHYELEHRISELKFWDCLKGPEHDWRRK